MICEIMTNICVSLIERSFSDIRAVIDEIRSQGAEVIEIRLDFLEDPLKEPTLNALLDIRKEVNIPFIITVRPTSESGHFKGDEDIRIQLLSHAMEIGFDYVDLEFSIEDDKRTILIEKAKELGIKTIISSHEFATSPSKEVIFERIFACHKTKGDIAKVIAPCSTLEDVNDILWAANKANQKGYDHCVMGLGPNGHITRILAPYIGSEMVYCSLKEAKKVAEGQVPISTLKEIWKNLGI